MELGEDGGPCDGLQSLQLSSSSNVDTLEEVRKKERGEAEENQGEG